MINLVLLGGGGHCLSVLEVISRLDEVAVASVLDHDAKTGTTVGNFTISETDDKIDFYVEKGCEFLISVGYVKSVKLRVELANKLNKAGAQAARLFASSAYVSNSAQVGEGSIVMHNALINAEATLGKHCIVNNNALVEHSVKIEDHCHIATGAIVNGDCQIGARSLVGSGAIIKQGVSICSDVVIGAGSLIVKDITKAGTYFSKSSLVSK